MWQKIQTLLRQVFTPQRLMQIGGTALVICLFWVWTWTPSPVAASNEIVMGEASLNITNVWSSKAVPLNRQSTLIVSVGQPQGNTDAEFPTLDRQIAALAGNAVCDYIQNNWFGYRLVDSALTVDFMLDRQGVTLADIRPYTDGVLYGVTMANPPQNTPADASPAPIQVVNAEITIDQLSRTGLSIHDYTIYLTLMIDQTGKITCLLGTKPRPLSTLLATSSATMRITSPVAEMTLPSAISQGAYERRFIFISRISVRFASPNRL